MNTPLQPNDPLAANLTPDNGDDLHGVSARKRTGSSALAERLRHLDEPTHPDGEAPRASFFRTGMMLVLGLVLAGTGAAAGGWYYLTLLSAEDTSLQFEPVERGRLVFSIVEKGELEASRNTDINCKVRASGRGNSVATSIKWLIDEGTRVKAGDVICRLDDSSLKEQLKNQEIAVASARAGLIQAEKDVEITASQNEGDLETARNNVKLAEIDLERYIRGERDKLEKNILGKLAAAEADLLQWKDKAAYSARMAKRGFVSRSQAQSDEYRRMTSEITYSELERDYMMLLDYDSRRTILDLQNKLEQAKTALKVAEISAAGKTAKAQADYQAKLQVLQQEESKLQDLKDDIANCTITAPHDGMVIYHVDERTRFGVSTSQNIVAVNEPVREGQRLMRIPDLSEMQVKIKVHEALVPRLIKQQESTADGLPAQIKIASLDRPLRGRVKDVSSVASSSDWSMADVKVYPTIVLIDEKFEGLKPGMSAEVTIKVEELENVLRVPVHAVLEANGRKFCYVKTPQGIEKRIITTGLNNSKFVEIKEGDPPAGLLKEGEVYGVKEGELILINPRGLAEKRNDLHAEQRDPGELVSATINNGPRPNRNGNGNGSGPAVGDGQPRGPGENGLARPPREGGPNAGGPRPGGGFQPSEEQRQQMQRFQEELRKATPERRKQMIDELPLPDNVKEMIKQRTRAQGLEVPD
jgi:multidrug efflux pump subunit AcrA (membrane-fusion protein)